MRSGSKQSPEDFATAVGGTEAKQILEGDVKALDTPTTREAMQAAMADPDGYQTGMKA